MVLFYHGELWAFGRLVCWESYLKAGKFTTRKRRNWIARAEQTKKNMFVIIENRTGDRLVVSHTLYMTLVYMNTSNRY